MKKIYLSAIVIILNVAAHAQDAGLKDVKSSATQTVKGVDDTAFKTGWRKGGLASLSFTQVNNDNWVAAGGDKYSLSMSGTLNLFATKKWDRHTWDNILDVNYGLVNTTTLGVRKVNDLLNFVSKLGVEPNNWKNVSITLLGQFRSQLTNGYDYNYFNSGQKRRNSGFFAPAYITIAPGFDWHPKPWLSVFGSPAALRWTIVSNGPYSFAGPGGIFTYNGTQYQESALATLYGVDPAKENLAQFGAFITINANKEIVKNVTYIGKMDLYSNYLKNPKNVALFWTNQFLMKVNKWLSVTYEIDLLDDDNIRLATDATHAVGLQVLSTLGVGIAAKF
jgi:hypothetical protein